MYIYRAADNEKKERTQLTAISSIYRLRKVI